MSKYLHRARKCTKKIPNYDVSPFIETIDQHYNELKVINERNLKEIQRKLIILRKAIRRYDTAPYYHKRNRAMRIYLELQRKKTKLANQGWEKSFLQDIHPLLNRYEEIVHHNQNRSLYPLSQKGTNISSSSNYAPSSIFVKPIPRERECNTTTVEQNAKMVQLNEAFLSQHRRDEVPTKLQQIEECMNPKCNLQPLLIIQKEARIVCPSCAQYSKHFSTLSSNFHSHDDSQNVIQHAYERKKNFKAFLSQFHENSKEISVELIRFLQRNFRDILYRSKLEVKSTPIKNKLKNSKKWKKYVDCSSKIANILNRRIVPKFSQEQIDLFVSMFEQTEIPFSQFKTIYRTNFMNSSYLMNKFLGLVDLTHYQSAFPLLRHRRTLQDQDITWAAMCNYLGWKYERSI